MATTREPTKSEPLKQVQQFKYFGSIIETPDCSQEIREPLGAASVDRRSPEVMRKDCALQKPTKLKVMKTLVRLVATYGCETWTLWGNDIA